MAEGLHAAVWGSRVLGFRGLGVSGFRGLGALGVKAQWCKGFGFKGSAYGGRIRAFR